MELIKLVNLHLYYNDTAASAPAPFSLREKVRILKILTGHKQYTREAFGL